MLLLARCVFAESARDLEAVGALLAHDFGAPIATLRGLLNVIKDDVDDGFTEELPELIDSALLMLNDVDVLYDRMLAMIRRSEDGHGLSSSAVVSGAA